MELQNHPERREFPVRPGSGYPRVPGARPPVAARVQWLTVFGSVSVGAYCVLGAVYYDRIFPPGVLLVLVGVTAVLIAVSLVLVWWNRRAPIREQRQYRRLGKVPPLSEEQQRLLALSAVTDFEGGLWNSSLERLPTEARFPGGEVPAFTTFVVHPTQQDRNYLDYRYRVANNVGVHAAFDRLFAQDSQSAKFVDLLADPMRAEAVDRLAALCSLPVPEIRALGAAAQGHHAPLLRANDVLLAVGLVRLSFEAGLLAEREAWALLARAGSAATECFSDAQAYWSNVRVGLAFTDDSVGVIAGFDATYAEFRRSNWPATTYSFPDRPMDDLNRSTI